MQLHTELQHGAAKLTKTLQALNPQPNEYDTTEIHTLHRIAHKNPALLSPPPPVLYHPSKRNDANLLYGVDATDEATLDAPYRMGKWQCPKKTVLAGVATLDLGDASPMGVPCAVLVRSNSVDPDGRDNVTITLLCPDTPLAALEHQLLDERVEMTEFERKLQLDQLPNEESVQRKKFVRELLSRVDLKTFPSFLVESPYYIHRKAVHPFLRLVLPRNARELRDAKGLRRHLNSMGVKVEQDENIWDVVTTPSGKGQTSVNYNFEIVLQTRPHGDAVDESREARQVKVVPIIAPLVRIFLLETVRAASQAPKPGSYMGEEEAFSDHLKELAAKEATAVSEAENKAGLAREFEERSLAGLSKLTRRNPQLKGFGIGEQLDAFVLHLFSEQAHEVLTREFRKAKERTLETDLETLATLLGKQQLVAVTKIGDNGLIENTTLWGGKLTRTKIGMDALARLCMQPWCAHLVVADGGLSCQRPEDHGCTHLELSSERLPRLGSASLLEAATGADAGIGASDPAALQAALQPGIDKMISETSTTARVAAEGAAAVRAAAASAEAAAAEATAAAASAATAAEEVKAAALVTKEATAEVKAASAESATEAAKGVAAEGKAAVERAIKGLGVARVQEQGVERGVELPPRKRAAPDCTKSAVFALRDAVAKMRKVDEVFNARLDALIAA